MQEAFSMKIITIIAGILILAGCAGQPVSQLRQNVQSTVIVQHGNKPLGFSTGVIDASSFWAQYGEGVSAQTGGWLWVSMANSGRKVGQEKTLTNAELVEGLFADHTMVESISKALLPELSRLWNPSLLNHKNQVIAANSISIDPETNILSGFESNADIVLVLDVRNINLTERGTVGGAFAAGFTMGMNKKSLTTETTIVMKAFKADANGDYKSIWAHTCGANYVTMKTSYYMDELMASKPKMTEILNEATQQSIDGCTRLLRAQTS